MGKILVVDDDENICRFIRDFFLELQGHLVFMTHNAKSALELIREHHP